MAREYPNGRLGADDDGLLRVALAADHARGVVRLDFGKAVEWIALPPEHAVALAALMIRKAREVSKTPLTVDLG